MRGATTRGEGPTGIWVFQPTLPLRGATCSGCASTRWPTCVSTHAPLAGSDGRDWLGEVVVRVSTHAPLAGSDHVARVARRSRLVSTHAPLAGSDRGRGQALREDRVSTHAPLAGSDRGVQPGAPLRIVSTHAPLAGSDPSRAGRLVPIIVCFNPRSPCGERHFLIVEGARLDLFQPTLPLRGATCGASRRHRHSKGFNPRSPCGERPQAPSLSDDVAEFQPTLPLRGATDFSNYFGNIDHVSTHAPLAGSDAQPPARSVHALAVSTHAPLAGSDKPRAPRSSGATGFNPRSPCGERRILPELARVHLVSTHAPLAGSDLWRSSCRRIDRRFQPTLPLRGATNLTRAGAGASCFNPRSPCGERPG